MYYTNINDYELLLNKNRLNKNPLNKNLLKENQLSKNDDPSPGNGLALTVVITLLTLFLLLP